MAIVFGGIDLAKNMFAMRGVDDHGEAALVRPAVRRDQFMKLAARLPIGSIGVQGVFGHTPPSATCGC